MGGYLRVQTDDLHTAGAALGQVKVDLDDARDVVDDVGGIIGHATLAHRVHSFGTNWDEHRKKITAAIDGLGQAAEQAGGTYEQIEADLVKAVSSKS